jgi:hypothetical protein
MIVKLEKGTHGEPDHVGSVDQPWKVFDQLRVLSSMKTHTITPTVIRQDQQPAPRAAE